MKSGSDGVLQLFLFCFAFPSVPQEIGETDTPGTAPINLLSLNFRKLPKTFYPLSHLDDYVTPVPYAAEDIS